MAGDDIIAKHEQAEAEARAKDPRAVNLFDVRRAIGGLFLLYGLVLFVLGLGASDEDIERAAGVNVNLWTGLAMLVVGGLFVAWALLRPLGEELKEPGEGERAGPPGSPAPSGVDAAALSSKEARRRARSDRERPSGRGDPGA